MEHNLLESSHGDNHQLHVSVQNSLSEFPTATDISDQVGSSEPG